MALNNREYDIGSLAEITENGFSAALFPQIRDAYAKAIKSIYGEDIDISSASADGQYINMEALILNNIYRTLENINDNLIPASATGKYLDILAGFSGVYRQYETHSTAQVWVANSGDRDITPESIFCIDKNGNQWLWLNPLSYNGSAWSPSVTFAGKSDNNYYPQLITLSAVDLGPTVANGANDTHFDPTDQTSINTFFNNLANVSGDIYQTVNATSLLVFQNSDAIVGKSVESDSSLRERMGKSHGAFGTTTIDSLAANLLEIESVDDVFVYSNGTDVTENMDDGVSVLNHDVYVCVWKNETDTSNSLTASDYTIGDTIFNQLTPGVLTTAGVATGGVGKEYTVYFDQGFSTTVEWKSCIPMNCSMQIVGKTGFSSLSTEQENAIKSTVVNYLNGIKLNEQVVFSDLMTRIMATMFSIDNSKMFYLTEVQPYITDGYKTGKSVGKLPLTRYRLTTDLVSVAINSGASTITITVNGTSTSWTSGLVN